MQSTAKSVAEYLDGLPDDRRRAVEAVRRVILENLQPGFEEGMQYGMIGYFVPHSIYPHGYHARPEEPLPFASLASQKNHMAVYLTCVYGDPDHEHWFRQAWAASGKKLDMGKSCVRFKKVDDLALDVLGEAIRRVTVDEFVASYERTVKGGGKRRAAKGPSTTKHG